MASKGVNSLGRVSLEHKLAKKERQKEKDMKQALHHQIGFCIKDLHSDQLKCTAVSKGPCRLDATLIKPKFLSLGSLDIWDQIIFGWGEGLSCALCDI